MLPLVARTESVLSLKDLEITAARGSGPGGQHRNKTDSAIRIVHKPTGIMVWSENGRSQLHNKETALNMIYAKVQREHETKVTDRIRQDRARMVGSGERGDKRRTIRVRDNEVIDHISGQSWKYTDYQKGIINAKKSTDAN